MTDLRALFEALGLADVRTLQNSGNVVFSSPRSSKRDLLARIENRVAAELGITTQVTVLSAGEVAVAVRDHPLAGVATRPSDLLVVVPRTRSDLRLLRPLLAQRWAPEIFALGRRVGYVWCANGVPRSPLWAVVDRALARTGTVRNLATFTKALALLEARP